MFSEMFKTDEPIITSLLDVDFYKFPMGQMIQLLYPTIRATFGLTNRTKSVRLGDEICIEQVREELDYVRKNVAANKTELHYLRGTNEYQERMFREPYLEFLGKLQLPEYELRKRSDGQIHLEFPGLWAEDTYWETMGLAIVNELRNRSILEKMTRAERNNVFKTGRLRLEEKIKKLKERPGITFIEFGTRRRFCKKWQEYVIQRLMEELPATQFLGTSNTYFAMKYGLLAMGTSAHELPMVLAGVFDDGTCNAPQKATEQVLKDWWDLYGFGLSIALPDTFGTDFFLKIMKSEQAVNWKGSRQDSGDPFVYGDKHIEFYRRCGIDPLNKLIVFSDGLDIDRIFAIDDYFRGRIKGTNGWGTDLTNDLGILPLSLVVKTIRANGRGLVKLSDNLAKAIGEPEDVERYKRICGYTNTTYTTCRY